MKDVDPVSAQALAVARSTVAQLMESMNFFGVTVAPLQAGGGRLVLRGMIKQWALFHPLNMAQACAWARAGWDDADRAMREMIAEFAERQEQMPVALRAYSIELILPNRPMPATPRGRKKASQVLQDIAIVWMIIELVEQFGLKPTRRQTRQPSACAVVAEALAEAGIHRGGERAVEKVWQRNSPGILVGFRWNSPSGSVRN
jgi:hypothetical protein